MREIFEKVHDAVTQTVKGDVVPYTTVTVMKIPGFSPNEKKIVSYSEFGGVVAGEIFEGPTSVGKFLGYPQGKEAFEIVAVAPANSQSVIDVVNGEKDAGQKHVTNFATRLKVEGFTFNQAYAI